MGRFGQTKYEGELREILAGREPGWAPHDLKKPFFAVRAGASLGIEVVAVRGTLTLAVEVKAAFEDEVRISRTKVKREQYVEMLGLPATHHVWPLYGFKRKKGKHEAALKVDPWVLFRLPSGPPPPEPLSIVPVHGTTRRDQPVLRWKEGMGLNQFLTHALNLDERFPQ